MYFILIIVYVLIAVAGMVLFKLGTQKQFEVGLNNGNLFLNINALAILGLSCYIFSFLLYMFLISQLELGYIASVGTGLVYLLTFASSILIFKEAMNMYNYVGAVLILAGIIFMNFKK